MPIKKIAPVADEYVDESVLEAEDPDEQSESSASVQSGWDAAKALLASSRSGSSDNKFASYFRFTEEPSLIAFIKDEPLTDGVFRQHWTSRSYRCLEKGCPLCAAGNDPTPKFTFWVLHYEVDGDDITPTPKLMTVGPRVLRDLLAINDDVRRGGPLQGRFFAASKTGAKQQTQYHFVPVKARDIPEDWGFDAKDAVEELENAQRLEEPSIYKNSFEELEEAARALA